MGIFIYGLSMCHVCLIGKEAGRITMKHDSNTQESMVGSDAEILTSEDFMSYVEDTMGLPVEGMTEMERRQKKLFWVDPSDGHEYDILKDIEGFRTAFSKLTFPPLGFNVPFEDGAMIRYMTPATKGPYEQAEMAFKTNFQILEIGVYDNYVVEKIANPVIRKTRKQVRKNLDDAMTRFEYEPREVTQFLLGVTFRSLDKKARLTAQMRVYDQKYTTEYANWWKEQIPLRIAVKARGQWTDVRVVPMSQINQG
jgi:hypothetical protein